MRRIGISFVIKQKDCCALAISVFEKVPFNTQFQGLSLVELGQVWVQHETTFHAIFGDRSDSTATSAASVTNNGEGDRCGKQEMSHVRTTDMKTVIINNKAIALL